MQSIAGAYASDSENGDDLSMPPVNAVAKDASTIMSAEPATKRARTDRRPVLPPEPSGEPDLELTKRLAQFREKGYNPTQHIRQNREFSNPQILQKIVDYFEIDDIGSCYPKHIFDPQAIVARRARDKSVQPREASGEDRAAAPASNIATVSSPS